MQLVISDQKHGFGHQQSAKSANTFGKIWSKTLTKYFFVECYKIVTWRFFHFSGCAMREMHYISSSSVLSPT